MYKVSKNSKGISKKVIVSLVAFIVLLVAGAAIFGATIKDSPFFAKDKVPLQEKEAEDVVKKVGKLIVLPEGKATIATVSDITKLSGQSFFKNAQNGDKVLIYTESQKAVLYRPSINKIVEVGPVFANVTPPTAAPSPTISPKPTATN